MKNLQFETLNMDNVQFSTPVKTNIGYNIYVSYVSPNDVSRKQRIRFLTPPLNLKFGIDKKDEYKYTMNMELYGWGKEERSNRFFEFLLDLENTIKMHCTLNARFEDGRKLDNFFSPVQSKRNPKYKPFVRVKLPVRYRKINFKIFEVPRHKGQPAKRAHLEKLQKGTKMQLVLELPPVWVIKRRFGFYFNVREIYCL